MSCTHYLVWDIVLEISNEMAKNTTQKNVERKLTTMSRKNLRFDYGQQCNNT